MKESIAALFLALMLPHSAKDPAHERLIFVDPPLRVLTQCELQEINANGIVCTRDGSSRAVAVNRAKVPVWKGADGRGTASLALGDMLDIKLGLDPQGRETAQFIWANLVKLEGVVGGVAGPWIRFYPLVPASVGEVSAEPVFVLMDRETEFMAGARASDLRERRPAIVIGMRLDDRRMRANRILTARE